MRQLKILAGMWAAGAAIFFVVNVWISPGLAVEVGAVILIGGLVTGAMGYLLIERINRQLTERALTIGPPRRAAGPGVLARLVLTWTVGTAIFLLGISALALATLIDPSDDTLRRVSASVLILSAAGLAVGLLATSVAARSVADPLRAVRSALGAGRERRLRRRGPGRRRHRGRPAAGRASTAWSPGLRERERLRDLFGRHVGEDVAARGARRAASRWAARCARWRCCSSTSSARPRWRVDGRPSEVVAALNRVLRRRRRGRRRARRLGEQVRGRRGAVRVRRAGRARRPPPAARCAAARELRERLRARCPTSTPASASRPATVGRRQRRRRASASSTPSSATRSTRPRG